MKELTQERIQELVNGILEYCDKNHLYIEYYDGINEPGYNDVPTLLANWNEPKLHKIADWIENYFDVSTELNIEWEDEWTSCQECGKLVRTSPDGHGWQQYYVVFNDCELVCGDCCLENIENVIEECKNQEKGVPEHFIHEIRKAGFHCIEDEDMCKRYETGWHAGQNDTPQKALEEIYEEFGGEWFNSKFDYLFVIDNVSQFYINWSVLVREKELETV